MVAVAVDDDLTTVITDVPRRNLQGDVQENIFDFGVVLISG